MLLKDAWNERPSSWSGGEFSHGLTYAEAALLAKMKEKKGTVLLGPAAKLGIDATALQRLQRCRLIEIQETVQGRSRRTQRVIAWTDSHAAATETTPGKSEENLNAETQKWQRNGREERIQ